MIAERLRDLTVCAGAAFALSACASEARPSWQTVSSLEQQGWLVSTTASPAGDVWLAFGGEPERGAIVRETRPGEWTRESIPEVPLLNWGQVFADGRAIAVGNKGKILRFDGQTWQLDVTPSEQDLWGVWGARPDDVWAVGGAGQAPGQATLLHFDGASWQSVALPALERPNVWALFKVWGSSEGDVYAVGQRGAVLHYDGTRWSELGVGTGEDLIAVYGTGPDRIAIVGGRSSGFVATYDGTRWIGKSLAPLPGLNGVFMRDRETIHVAGIRGTLASVAFTTLEYEPSYEPTELTFHALHGAADRLLAVGGNLDATRAPYLGLARERKE